jgi:hypothetical protein
MTMSMEWDYVSEPRPPTGLLFISQLIHEHGEPLWNYIDRRRLLISTMLLVSFLRSAVIHKEIVNETKLREPTIKCKSLETTLLNRVQTRESRVLFFGSPTYTSSKNSFLSNKNDVMHEIWFSWGKEKRKTNRDLDKFVLLQGTSILKNH